MKNAALLIISMTLALGSCTGEAPKETTPVKGSQATNTPVRKGGLRVDDIYLRAGDFPGGGFTIVRDQSHVKVVTRLGPYIKNKGIHTGYRMWKGNAILVDSRWLFPDDAKAGNFFTEAAAMNAEGLKRGADPQVAHEAHLYEGIIKHPKLPLQLRSAILYFRQGRVVGKIFMAWEQPLGTDKNRAPELSTLVKALLPRLK